MHPLTHVLLACADAGAYKCTIIAVVLNTGDTGTTCAELADMLSQSPYSVKYTIRAGVKAGWLRATGATRGRNNVYARTHAGQQLTNRICKSY